MTPYRFSRIPFLPSCDSHPKISCLTINHPQAPVGLVNLLDLTHHEISLEGGKQVHRLTFKSGETLVIKANHGYVTIRGARINYQATDQFPYSTVLDDPAA